MLLATEAVIKEGPDLWLALYLLFPIPMTNPYHRSISLKLETFDRILKGRSLLTKHLEKGF